MAIDIAISLAPNYAIRSLVLPSRGVDRNMADEVIRDRVMKALGRYHITREALAHEELWGICPYSRRMIFIGKLGGNKPFLAGDNPGTPILGLPLCDVFMQSGK